VKQPVLVKVVGEKVDQLKEISQQELETLNNSKATIFEFNREFQLIDYVNENYDSFLRELTVMVKDFNANKHVLTPFIYDEFIRFINRSILNILTSMRTMTDHLETKVKRTYGEQSTEWEELKKQLSLVFDTQFSYCFASKLRNYVQHCGMPPINFSFKNEMADSEIQSSINIDFNRDKLLEDFTKWGTIVKPQLQQQPESFCVFNVLESLVHSLFQVFARFIQKTKFSNVQESRDWILNYIDEPLGYQSNEYAIGYLVPNEDKSVSMKLSWIPASLFEKVEKIERYL